MTLPPELDKALADLLRSLPALISITLILGLGYLLFSSQIPRPQTSTQNSPSAPNPNLPRPAILQASSHFNDKKHHLLLAATGSVATIKIPQIIHSLSHHPNLSIRLILTNSASNFLQGQSHEQPSLPDLLKNNPNLEAIYHDSDEWHEPWIRGNSILHIELRRWADLMVIAPLSANALARIVNGFSDTLVYSVVRAWDTAGLIDAPRPGIVLPYGDGKEQKGTEREGMGRKGIIVAPAMNTAMWNHEVTRKQMGVLEGEWSVEKGGWVEVLRPIEKRIACGDTGSGGMHAWEDIVKVVEERLRLTLADKER